MNEERSIELRSSGLNIDFSHGGTSRADPLGCAAGRLSHRPTSFHGSAIRQAVCKTAVAKQGGSGRLERYQRRPPLQGSSIVELRFVKPTDAGASPAPAATLTGV